MRSPKTFFTRFAACLCLWILAGCDNRGAGFIRHEITGEKEERVSKITSILEHETKLPGPLTDARFTEDHTAPSICPGPTDFFDSGRIEVAEADIPAWRVFLGTKLPNPDNAAYRSPIKAPEWWPATFPIDAEFYEPQKLTGRSRGFLYLSPSTHTLVFSVYTQ